ncbi:MAG: biopolymer transporter ExbD [Bacteroidota bacterium]|nr:biopolymer transporter ExbD [Bacteroidota bacterium]
MAIKLRNKVSTEFNTSAMSDLVFLLLIFFMITSTLVSPNAIKLLLPSSDSRTMAKQTVTVYINDKYDFFIEEKQVNEQGLQKGLSDALALQADGSVVLRADKSVPVQYVVNVIDAVNNINNANKTKYKVILATQSKK